MAKAEKDTLINPEGYKLMDNLAIHYYPNFRTDINNINSIVRDSSGKQYVSKMLEATKVLHDPNYINKYDLSSYKNFKPNILGRMNAWLKEYYPEAKLVINEFALDSDYRTFNYHPIIRPLYLADTVGILAENNVDFFNRFILNTPLYSKTPWALLQENKKKTNLFFMYKLFTKNFKGSVVKLESNLDDKLNTYALKTENEIKLLLVNKSPRAKKVKIYNKNMLGIKKTFNI